MTEITKILAGSCVYIQPASNRCRERRKWWHHESAQQTQVEPNALREVIRNTVGRGAPAEPIRLPVALPVGPTSNSVSNGQRRA